MDKKNFDREKDREAAIKNLGGLTALYEKHLAKFKIKNKCLCLNRPRKSCPPLGCIFVRNFLHLWVQRSRRQRRCLRADKNERQEDAHKMSKKFHMKRFYFLDASFAGVFGCSALFAGAGLSVLGAASPLASGFESDTEGTPLLLSKRLLVPCP